MQMDRNGQIVRFFPLPKKPSVNCAALLFEEYKKNGNKNAIEVMLIRPQYFPDFSAAFRPIFSHHNLSQQQTFFHLAFE